MLFIKKTISPLRAQLSAEGLQILSPREVADVDGLQISLMHT